MKKLPKISIVTVNFNQEEVTCDMLKSLRHITWPNIEVFVVDNASVRDCSVIKARYPEVKLIKSLVNLGFAGGNNLAINEATGDYILLLNNDTIVTPGFIEPLMDTFERNPDAGIVSPKIVFYYSDNLVQYAGTNPISNITCRGETIGYMQKDNTRFDVEYPTHLSHGACMMFGRAVLDKVGLMDENYFMFYEEYDYCERVRKAGFGIYYNGHSSILHKQSISIGKNSAVKSYYMTRNRLYFSRKNFTGASKLLAVLYNYAIALPKNALQELLKGRVENSVAIVKGSFWNLFHKVQRI
jgi:GT2 family glycosyltransferase